MTKPGRRQPPARALCHAFEGSSLVGCARAGLGALEAIHKPIITSQGQVGCGIHLDHCRRELEDQVERWDYVFTMRDGDGAIAVEVHHADPDQVDKMIGKKAWAEDLLATECPELEVMKWVWIASPPQQGGNAMIGFRHGSPQATRLSQAQIEFPRSRLDLP